MFRKTVLTGVLAVALTASSAMAADVKKRFTIESAKMYDSVQEVMNRGNVSFYWGDQKHPAVKTKHGVFKTSKRTNGFMKENEAACAHALASALAVFEDRAMKEGGNAVINIKSNLSNNPESSATDYSCMVGTVMVNVAIEADVVTLAK